MSVVEEQGEPFRFGRSQEVLEAVTRYSGDCVLLMDLDGVIRRWNPMCEDLFGWRAEEAIGQQLLHIPKERRLRVLRELRTAAAEGRVTERDMPSLRSGGSRSLMRMTLIPVHDDDGDPAGVLAIVREVLDDERNERTRNEFSAFIGESLSAPLNSIVTAAELLLRPEMASDTSRRVRLSALVSHHAREAAVLVDDLLLTSRIATGDLVLDREPADLGGLVGEAVAAVPGAEKRTIVDFDSAMEPVLVDVNRVRRVVAILIKHALDRTAEPQTVQVSVSRRRNEAIIEVRCSGERTAVSRQDLSEHAGIALHLARGVAEAHGGSVYVREADGDDGASMLLLPVSEGPVTR